MRYRFVVNPLAGRVPLKSLLSCIHEQFRGLDYELLVDGMKVRGDSRSRASSADPDLAWVAVGGDGTVNRVINDPRREGAPVGILPAGTANDLAAELGIPAHLPAACGALREGKPVEIDLLAVNGRRFATCGGLGLGARAAHRLNRWRQSGGAGRLLPRILGRWIYPLFATGEILRSSRPTPVSIRCRGRSWSADSMAVLVSNLPRLGGVRGMLTGASPRDGLLDLWEIHSPGRRSATLWVLVQALRGKLGRLEGVERMRARSASLTASQPAPFFGDGEILAEGLRFEVETLPGALRVLAPSPRGDPR